MLLLAGQVMIKMGLPLPQHAGRQRKSTSCETAEERAGKVRERFSMAWRTGGCQSALITMCLPAWSMTHTEVLC